VIRSSSLREWSPASRAAHGPATVVLFTVLLATATPVLLFAQATPGVVLDQTGLPLPGVRIDLERQGQVVEHATTEGDGTFTLRGGLKDDIVVAVLDGFETTRASLTPEMRIVMPLAHASEVTEVRGSALTSSGAAMERLGSTMSAPLAERLPVARPRILQSLPLLPGVIRGSDGQLRIGGTRPHEGSLWIDGFDVTDPVTRTSTIDLPNESVKGMAVLRDPVAATFTGVLGSLASIETLPGGNAFHAGIQGFIPRPRLTKYGLGRIEGFFPRAYAGGRLGRARYFVSTEFNFERVPVPGVTSRSGRPDTGATGVTSFSRVDVDLSTSQRLTFDGLFAPGRTTLTGLSPLRGPEASPDVRTRDIVAGLIDHIVIGSADLLTLRAGHVGHRTALAARGAGDSLLLPSGWRQNWFASVDHWGTQQSLSATWDHAGWQWRGAHTVTTVANFRLRAMNATVDESPIRVLDDANRLTRLVAFGPTARVRAGDTTAGAGLRDLWDVTGRLQLDLDVRADRSDDSGRIVGSPRMGVRYALDGQASTVIKASAGRFVGFAPLGAFSFAQFPSRTDSTFDPMTGTIVQTAMHTSTVATVELPRADGVAFDVEHRLTPRLQLEAGVRARRGSKLPTVIVPPAGGSLLLASVGTSRYRELQVSMRQAWRADAQAFVSYVWSSSRGDVNDFGSLYTSLTAPFVEPGADAPTPGDVPHRLRGWATMGLPRHVVVSPSLEWRTGFPYSVLNLAREYVGTPNGARFQSYFSADVTAFKTFDILRRKIDLGLQVFNLTRHFNPRDVISIKGSSQFQQFTNSFGTTLGGYMQVRWE
jgi:hypothetical protein